MLAHRKRTATLSSGVLWAARRVAFTSIMDSVALLARYPASRRAALLAMIEVQAMKQVISERRWYYSIPNRYRTPPVT